MRDDQAGDVADRLMGVVRRIRSAVSAAALLGLVTGCVTAPPEDTREAVPRDKWPVLIVVPAPMPSGAVQSGPPLPPEPEVSSGPTNAFAKCHACHSVMPGRNGIGPSLAGVYGRLAGTAERYRYSPDLAASGIRWDQASLDVWLSGPRAMVPQTKMTFAGLGRPEERAEIIAFLKTL